MPQLEAAILAIEKVFDTYSCKEGKKDTLTKYELKTLLENEFPAFIKACKDPYKMDQMMKTLDENRDQEVDFGEYFKFVLQMSEICQGSK